MYEMSDMEVEKLHRRIRPEMLNEDEPRRESPLVDIVKDGTIFRSR